MQASKGYRKLRLSAAKFEVCFGLNAAALLMGLISRRIGAAPLTRSVTPVEMV